MKKFRASFKSHECSAYSSDGLLPLGGWLEAVWKFLFSDIFLMQNEIETFSLFVLKCLDIHSFWGKKDPGDSNEESKMLDAHSFHQFMVDGLFLLFTAGEKGGR